MGGIDHAGDHVSVCHQPQRLHGLSLRGQATRSAVAPVVRWTTFSRRWAAASALGRETWSPSVTRTSRGTVRSMKCISSTPAASADRKTAIGAQAHAPRRARAVSPLRRRVTRRSSPTLIRLLVLGGRSASRAADLPDRAEVIRRVRDAAGHPPGGGIPHFARLGQCSAPGFRLAP